MKVQSFKSAMFVGVCLWGATGALAFWAGRNYGVSGSALTSSGKGGKGSMTVDAFGRAVDQAKLAAGKNLVVPTIEELLRAKGNKIDPASLAIWAASLSPADCAKNLDDLQKMPAGAKRDAMLTALSNQWAKTDPKGFLASAGKVASPLAKQSSTVTALTALATQDPKAALQWLKDNPGSTSALNTQEYNAIVAGYAANNPAEAFNMVNTMPDGANAFSPESRAKLAAFQALISGVGANGNFSDAVAMVNQLPAGTQLQNQAYGSLVAQWAQSSPADAAAWVAGSGTTPQQQRQYDSTIAASWAQTDPAAAAVWAAQADATLQASNANGTGGPGGGRGGRNNGLLATAVGQWVAEGGVNDAGAYLNSLPASTSKDQAVAAFVSGSSAEDPAGSMAWVNTISDPNLQQRAANQVAAQWNQVDPAGFNAYLATLPAAQAQQMAQAAQYGGGPGGGFGGGGFGGGGFGGGAGGGGGRRAGGGFGGGATNPATGLPTGPTVITNGGGRGGRRGGGGGGGAGG